MCAIVLLNFGKFRVVPLMSWAFVIMRLYIYIAAVEDIRVIFYFMRILYTYIYFFLLFNCIVFRNDITYILHIYMLVLTFFRHRGSI